MTQLPRHTEADYGQAYADLLPSGVPWPRDLDSVLMRLAQGLAGPFAGLEGRAIDLLENEADPRGTTEMLEDWERNAGLPDPCVAEPLTIEDRRKALYSRLTTIGRQDRAYFLEVAAGLGYSIEIEEYVPWMFGISYAGETRAYEGELAPALDLDFANGAYYGGKLEDIATVRASAGLAEKLDGTWLSFANHVPRITDKGLLVEEARTNSLPNGGMAGAAVGANGSPSGWNYNSGGLARGIVAVDTASPIATVDMQFSGTATGTSHYIDLNAATISAVPGETWTASMFFQQLVDDLDITGITIQLFALNSSGSQVGSPAALNITADRLTYKRHEITFANLPATTDRVLLRVVFARPAGAAIDHTFRIGSPQLEKGSSASSPIRTTGAAATRAADVITLALPGFYRPALTAYVQATPTGTAATGNPPMVQIDDGTLSNRLSLIRTSVKVAQAYSANPSLNAFIGGTNVGDAAFQMAAAFADGAYGLSVDGGAVAALASTGIYPAAFNRLQLGTNGSVWFNGYIGRVACFPSRLTDAQLQAISSGGMPEVPTRYAREIGPPEMRYVWRVKIIGTRLSWFRAGSGQFGIDPMLRIGIATDLECLLRRYKPAHTEIVFDYSEVA